DDLGIPATVGQRTGSPTVLAIEAQLGRGSPRFAADRSVMEREGLEALRTSAERIAATGEPAALAEAARLRARYFDELVSSRLREAETAATEAMQRLSTEGQAGRADASQRAYEALEGALTDSRRIETDLWDQIPRDVPVSGRGTLQAYGGVRNQ